MCTWKARRRAGKVVLDSLISHHVFKDYKRKSVSIVNYTAAKPLEDSRSNNSFNNKSKEKLNKTYIIRKYVGHTTGRY